MMSDLLNIDLVNPLMSAVTGTLILMFVISPLAGWLLLTKGAKFSTLIAAFAIGLLTLVTLFIGLNLVLGNALEENADNDPQVTLISFLVATIAAFIVGTYTGWVLAKPHSALQDELRNSQIARPEESLSYMAKRRERLSKKRRR